MTHHNIFVDGRVWVRRRQCASCIFGPRPAVGPERVAQLVAACRAEPEHGTIPCHSHLYQDEAVEPVCRGWYDHGETLALRLAAAMNLIGWVE